MAKVDMVMPQMGESISEGTIVRWAKKKGEKVERDEILLEISTDKVDSEIPSPHEGVIDEILVEEGETVEVGEVIARLTTDADEAEEKQEPETKEADKESDTEEKPAHEATKESGENGEQEPEPAKAEKKSQEQKPGPEPKAETAAKTDGGVVEMTMPQMGESISEGTIVKWLKQEGDKIEKDEILLEISTDKVDSEIPSPHAGTIQKILVGEGETVEVGNAIAKIATGEAVAAEAPEEPKERAEAAEEKEKKEEKPEAEPSRAESAPSARKTGREGETNGERRFYSPLVRQIARSESISEEELAQISGTGAHGRVTKKDILNYLDQRPAEPSEAPEAREAPRPERETPPAAAEEKPAPKPEAVEENGRVEIIPMDTMRKSIAKHMVNSVQTSPHVFAVSESDMTNLVAFRTQNKEGFQEKAGAKLTYMPFIVNACARALQDYPLVNSSVDGDKIIRKKYINVGIAVALENNGLIVPVVKNADGLNIVGLARNINDLATRARSKKLKPDEVQDGTFSITNMGSFGSIMGLPIINQPQVAILGVGAIQKRPVVINDAVAIRSMMYISLSFDHRIVDGALAGQFLDRIAQYLTNFDTSNIL